MLRTSSLAKKSKLIYHHPHQSKSLFHRVAPLRIVIGTIP